MGQKMNRRDFMKFAGKGVLAGFLAGSLPGAIGCAVNKGLTESKQSNLEEICNSEDSFNDPYNFSGYLEDREFVVPDKVFDSYAQIVDKKPDFGGAPAAGYLTKNYLDTEEELKEFNERLGNLNLSEIETEKYTRLFTSSDIIVIKESVLKDKEKFRKFLPHERFHKNIQKLDKQDYDYMMSVADDLVWKETDNGLRFVRERETSKYLGGFALAEATENPEEFYTYLAQGEFMPRVEKTLKEDYPKAYDLFNEIKNECEIK